MSVYRAQYFMLIEVNRKDAYLGTSMIRIPVGGNGRKGKGKSWGLCVQMSSILSEEMR